MFFLNFGPGSDPKMFGSRQVGMFAFRQLKDFTRPEEDSWKKKRRHRRL